MAAKKGKAREAVKPRARESVKLFSVLVKAFFALALIAGLLTTIIWLGYRAGEEVASQPRYTVPFAQISCASPPGVDRLAFLTEVRYLANWPDTVQTVEPGLAERLQAAFGRHPWVRQVGEVKISPDATIQVELTFREAVLTVRTATDNERRVVDQQAVLLPSGTAGESLPELVNPVLAPTRPAGEIWDDPTIRRAAELVELYKAQKPLRIEKTTKGWRLTLDGGRVVVVSL